MKPFALIAAALGPAALVSTLGRLSVDAAWVERLGWTLIHTVWQFALISLTAVLFQRSLRRRSARARYAAGAVLLGAMAVAPCVTCCVVDVSRPSEVKHARIAPTRTPDETPSSNALPFPHSPMDESAVSEPLVPGAPPRRHAAEPLATVRAHVAPHERPSPSWVAAFRSTLAPRLPLLVSFWLAGMALFALRPVWGLWMQWRLRRVGLSPVPASVTLCLDDLVRRLGLRRTVGIAQSVCVRVPMAVGYLRPLILLPGCVLTGLTASQLEALLAHELAHIRRHDWLVNAFQLLVETVFFYHPAVWWLSRQIRQERENCCDDLAVSLVGDRGTVGRMLLALEELRERTPGLALAATGGNLVSRVRRVVAKGRQPEPAGREWLPAAVFLLLAGLGGAAWALSAGADQRKNPPSATPAVTAKNDARRAAQTPDVRRIAGRVDDGKGQPVQAAHLWWVVRDNYPYERPFTIEGTSDAEGRFALEAPAVRKARRPGRTPADVLWVLAAGKDLKAIRSTKRTAAGIVRADLEISLEPATDSDYRVVDEQGRPVARAVVEPSHDLTPRGYEYMAEGVLGLLRRTTDSAGRVRLTSLPRKDLYVQIQAAGFGCQRQQFDGPDQSSPERKITLRRAGRVEGRLIADDPRWVRGIHHLYSTQPPPGGPTVPVTLSDGTKEERVIYKTEGEALVETDAQGHFQIPEIAAGASRIEVIDLPASCPVAPRMPSGLFVEAGETAHVDIPMEKLVRVKGTVRTNDPPSPVAGAEISVHYGKWFQEDVVTSDNQGHYEARVLPGSVYMRVRSKHPEIGAGYEENPMLWPKKVSVPDGGAEFELPPIVLDSTEKRTGTLIDQDGRPIASACVWGMRGDRPCGAAETNGRGEFSLRLPKKLGMDSYEVLQLDGRKRSRVKATILKYEPLTLQTDLAASPEKRAKPKPDSDNKRQKNDERKPTTSATPAPSLSAPASRPSTVLAAAGSKPSIGAPTITGTVSETDSKPVAGATVMIWAAGVKHGYSTYCPGCYADCGKRVVTDAAGAFAIARVDPELRFRLLVVREGYAPVFVEKVDPFSGPAAVKLSRRPATEDVHRVVHGHVVGPRGEPLAGAVVEAESVWYQDEQGHNSRTWGAVKGLDPLAVTNDQGDFEIAYAKPAQSITVMVRARGMAPQRFDALGTGSERHTLAVNRGASIRGRLVRYGKPAGRAEMGLAARDRTVDQFYSEVRIGTEPDGSFLFVNVPVPGAWYVYAKMESVLKRGATNAVECVTEREDETINLGAVKLEPGHRVRGRVVLTDGKPIPDGMRIFVSTQRAWDDQIHPLPPDGRFEFDGVPTDDISIHPAVKGYHPSGKNPNLNLGIDGFVDRDIDNFSILLDPGKDRFNRTGENFQGKPLRSAPQP